MMDLEHLRFLYVWRVSAVEYQSYSAFYSRIHSDDVGEVNITLGALVPDIMPRISARAQTGSVSVHVIALLGLRNPIPHQRI